jgi:hypothetical protein
VSERAVEKHTNSIFSKLGLSEEKEVNRRVKAVLVYLSDPGGADPTWTWCASTPVVDLCPMRRCIGDRAASRARRR